MVFKNKMLITAFILGQENFTTQNSIEQVFDEVGIIFIVAFPTVFAITLRLNQKFVLSH
jgi:hypothetical protein